MPYGQSADWPRVVAGEHVGAARAATDRRRSARRPAPGSGGPARPRGRGGAARPGVGPGQLERARDGAGVGERVGQLERLPPASPRTPVVKPTVARPPGGSLTTRRRLNTGSSTAPTVFDSGAPARAPPAAGVAPAAEEAAPGSVSYSRAGLAAPSTARHVDQPASGSLGRCAAGACRAAPRSATSSVSTNRLPKAGWARSAACGASATSA